MLSFLCNKNFQSDAHHASAEKPVCNCRKANVSEHEVKPKRPWKDETCLCKHGPYGNLETIRVRLIIKFSGAMICCDNTKCPVLWFHFACVDITSKPASSWYCPLCRGESSSVARGKRMNSTKKDGETNGK